MSNIRINNFLMVDSSPVCLVCKHFAKHGGRATLNAGPFASGRHVVEVNEIDVLAFTVLRDFE